MKKSDLIYEEIKKSFLDKTFMKEVGMTKKEITAFLSQKQWRELFESLSQISEENGRFNSLKIFETISSYIPNLDVTPRCGWMQHCYNWVLYQLFPELVTTDSDEKFKKGTAFILQILRGLYNYELATLPFNPTYNLKLLSDKEIEEKGFNQEYIKLNKLIKSKYIYEFMRIGVDLMPYNTLGHIGGVHYVAMYMARQLENTDVPIDLGLISGAAAGHDIGKYGCKKSEEKRIPYLHYYYTDICYNRFGIPTIGHIAANHSTWDLELENLSVESLILIYADFRVKSSRDKSGHEIVNFYSLDESFDVILNKLDNVDEAKEKRYRKVYSKLKDFENYMKEKGIVTQLPTDFSDTPHQSYKAPKHEMVLLNGQDIVNQLKYAAVEHNINLMSKFHVESEFGSLIEAARSERQWKNLRTYISTFGEYSTYMTEKQKLMTLKFLYELLSHKEGDIRNQSAEIMGHIIGTFSEEYKKELPEGITMKEKAINNLVLWEKYLEKILYPNHKFTEQHKRWIFGSLTFFAPAVLKSCKESCRYKYLRIFSKLFDASGYSQEVLLELLNTIFVIERTYFDETFEKDALAFINVAEKKGNTSVKIAAIKCRWHLSPDFTENEYDKAIRKVMNISSKEKEFNENLSNMFLDDLKAGTPWIVKIENIKFMLNSLNINNDNGSNLLHVATHFANLVKVSETITVRKAAGEGLLSIIDKLPSEQRNELTVELSNGLEIGDYQFSKYIPDYLGIIMLYLPSKELDESIADLQKIMENGNEKTASSVINTLAVMVENYHIYEKRFPLKTKESHQRKNKLLNLIIKAFASYNDVSSQEAFWNLGRTLFGSEKLSIDDKTIIFKHCYKKLITLLSEKNEGELTFYNNAAVLNHIYRYISEYETQFGEFQFEPINKVAFFPGTFDPFSLGHKAVATTIRDLGFEVYLALDEFSWSKNTQPRLQRRKIMNMSIADEDNLFVFPEDLPVNIANPKDIKKLKETFAGKELYIAVGTDVIKNASCYKAAPEENSIHSMNHIAFARESHAQNKEALHHNEDRYPITGEIINLTLKKYYEDISSTRIRENIDLNRDISYLIDTVAQNYIYDRNLYLREPAYKHILQAKELKISTYERRTAYEFLEIKEELVSRGYDFKHIEEYLNRSNVRALYIQSGNRSKKIVAFAAAQRIETSELLDEFHSTSIAAHIRESASGGIAVIGSMFVTKGRSISNVTQILITELLTELLSRDFAYVVYHPVDEAGLNPRIIEALKRQGFVNIAPVHSAKPIYAVDMKSPVILFRDVETVIKSPLNKNHRVLKATDEAHNRLLRVLTDIYPGELVLSFNNSAVHNKIIDLVAKINGVSTVPSDNKSKGPFMSVPFGKALSDVLVPNTVTKALHTEKYFNSNLRDFTIEESKHHSKLDNQAKTIKSFDRPIILIDDLLHKGYRMNIIDPILKKNNVDVEKIIVGVMTGNARDLMQMRNRSVTSAYFLPTLKVWINERDSYPFVGGDSLNTSEDASVNLIMPYTVPGFIADGDPDKIYDYSMTCLENARDILKVLEAEYQATFEKKLTFKRLGEVISYPRKPSLGTGISYDENLAPSVYIENDIEKLIRLKKATGK